MVHIIGSRFPFRCRLDEARRVQRNLSPECVLKNLYVFLLVICRPGERSERLVKELPSLDSREKVEEDDPEDDFLRVLGPFFDNLFYQKLASFVENAEGVTEEPLL